MKTFLAAAIAALALTGCSSSPNHNDADVAFAQGMIPHHEQAIEMSRTAAKSGGAEVRKLAAQIEAAQGPEIRTMSGWLDDWNAPVVDHGAGHSMDMGDGTMAKPGAGMLDETTMGQLDSASGAAFDRLWLRGMIKHHQGAIAMAKTELASGEFPKARAMAKAIVTTQQAEINRMRKLLK